MDYEGVMRETRCPNTGSLLFHPSPADLETIRIREDNELLKNKVDRLEKLVEQLLENQHDVQNSL